MKKILWLASWYPNKMDKFTGDFIQRHAKAASLFNQIIVLHVAKAEEFFFKENIFEEINTEGNLTEHIIYFKCSIRWKPLNKILSLVKYLWLFRKLIMIYLKDKNRPVLAHVHVPLKAGLMALWLKRRFGIGYVVTEHYGIYNNVVDEPFEKKSRLFRYFTKKIIRKAIAFSPVSKDIGEAINKMLLPKPYSVVYNTVDTRFFNYTRTAESKFRFVHVSNMAALKNVEGIVSSIVKVWVENKNIELVIVGKQNNEIIKLTEDTGLLNKAIFFTGEISYEEVAQQMKLSQSFILFSKTENMPCVILEALCCGLPVIATKVGGIPEVVDHQNGLLIESEDEIGLQRAIIAIASGYDRFSREEISKHSQLKFSYHTIGKQISDLYDECLSPQ